MLSAGRGYRIRGLDFSPTGDRLAVTDEQALELFDPLKRTSLQVVPRGSAGPLTLRYDSDPARPFVYRGTRNGFDRIAIPGGQKSKPPESFALGKVFRIESPARGGGLFVMGEVAVSRYDPAKFKAVITESPASDMPAGVALSTMAVRPDGAPKCSFRSRTGSSSCGSDTLKPLREWQVGDELLDARYTPDGTKVLIGRPDNVAELLDAATGAPTPTRPMTHTRAVAAVAVSPDGTVFLTGSRDGTARFWDATTGLPLGAALRHSGPVTHVAFAPNGTFVATGTGTGNVLVWGVPPQPAKGSIAELRAKWGKRE